MPKAACRVVAKVNQDLAAFGGFVVGTVGGVITVFT
jgi:hypothetical protein